MRISGRSLINPNLRVLLVPTLTIISVCVLFVLTLNIGFTRITTQISGYNSEKTKDTILKEKLDTITRLNSGGLLRSESVLIALPESNPATAEFSILRGSSNEGEISITKIGLVSISGLDNLETAEINLEFTVSDLTALYAFLDKISSYAPISSIKDLDIKGGGIDSGYSVSMQMTVYWASLPTTLPQVAEPITDLTDDEKKILILVQNLKQPAVGGVIPLGPKERPQPFN